VTCGVILWFTVLIAIVRKLGKRLSPSMTQHIVHGMGYVLIAAGTVMSVRSVVLLLRPS
jgi:membrane protein DedA with SNARE-associated domain